MSTSVILAKAHRDCEVRVTGKNDEGIAAVFEIGFADARTGVGGEAVGYDSV